MSIHVTVPAWAVLILNPADRRALMSAPETQWYRDQVDSIEELVADSPTVEVFMTGALDETQRSGYQSFTSYILPALLPTRPCPKCAI